MVEINKENKVVKIEFEQWCDVEKLVDMQTAIIDLISGYRYDDFGAGAGPMVSDALILLTALLPNLDQQGKAFIRNDNYLELPDNMTEKQRKSLRDALFTIRTGQSVTPGNMVLSALQDIQK
jgi:hypothetical protein